MSNIATVVPAQGAKMVLEERPMPSPGPDQVVVRTRAVALNPLDYKRQRWGLMTKFPAILGNDLSGTITAVGPSSSKSPRAFSPGDRVLALSGASVVGLPGAAFQTHVLVPHGPALSRIPDSLPFAEAAMLPTAVATASLALFHALGLPRPTVPPTPPAAAAATDIAEGGEEEKAETEEEEQGKEEQVEDQAQEALVIWGASGSVGSLAVQLASRANFTSTAAAGDKKRATTTATGPRIRIYAVASARHHARLRALGAHAVFEYRRAPDDDVADAIVAAVAADNCRLPIRLALDCVSEPGTLGAAVEVLRKAGAASSSCSSSDGTGKREGARQGGVEGEKRPKLAHLLPLAGPELGAFKVPEWLDMQWVDGGESYGECRDHAEWLFGEYLPRALELGEVVPAPGLRVVGEGEGLKGVQGGIDELAEGAVSGEKLVVCLDDE